MVGVPVERLESPQAGLLRAGEDSIVREGVDVDLVLPVREVSDQIRSLMSRAFQIDIPPVPRTPISVQLLPKKPAAGCEPDDPGGDFVIRAFDKESGHVTPLPIGKRKIAYFSDPMSPIFSVTSLTVFWAMTRAFFAPSTRISVICFGFFISFDFLLRKSEK